MDKNQVTVFLVTNDSSVNKKIVLPSGWLKGLGVVAIVLLIVGGAGLIDYVGLIAQSMENKRLRAENAQLQKQFQVVEGKLGALESSLDKVKSFTTKLKLITNVESEDRALKLTMGPNPPPNQEVEDMDQPMDQRPPVNEVAKQDQVLQEKKPVNEQAGELAVEGSRDYQTLAVRIDRAVKETQLKEQSVIDLWETLSERQSLLNAIPNIKPARGWLTSRFGYRISPFTGKSTMHAGLDIAAAPGSPVYAPADGVVSFAGYDEGYGKLVSIDHGYGIVTRFGHNSQIYVQVGQRVSRWDVIGAVGSTGRSTGPHVHYEVRVNGIPVNPINFILDE